MVGRQLDAVHVVSLDDDALRYFFPRLVELLLREPSPSFDFVYGLHRLKGRLVGWKPEESTVLRQLLETVWSELVAAYPSRFGYLSDLRSMLGFLDSCDVPLQPFLDNLKTVATLPAARHLADLISDVCTFETPFEPETNQTVLSRLRQAAIGERLRDAFFGTETDEAATQLSAAYELWTACIRP